MSKMSADTYACIFFFPKKQSCHAQLHACYGRKFCKIKSCVVLTQDSQCSNATLRGQWACNWFPWILWNSFRDHFLNVHSLIFTWGQYTKGALNKYYLHWHKKSILQTFVPMFHTYRAFARQHQKDLGSDSQLSGANDFIYIFMI